MTRLDEEEVEREHAADRGGNGGGLVAADRDEQHREQVDDPQVRGGGEPLESRHRESRDGDGRGRVEHADRHPRCGGSNTARGDRIHNYESSFCRAPGKRR